jgi:hypothetical protein
LTASYTIAATVRMAVSRWFLSLLPLAAARTLWQDCSAPSLSCQRDGKWQVLTLMAAPPSRRPHPGANIPVGGGLLKGIW